ncbi:MAG: substrate-binding domain-containing protein [Phycisphaerae bacterium]|nr:substrate-binding domain-containing protein [Phycisphaerae bacterium]
MRMPRSLLSIAVAACFIGGCGRSQETPKSGPTRTKGTIGLSVLTLTNPFFKVIADTMKVEGAKCGYKVDVKSGEFDVARQQNQVKDFIVQKVAAIVLTPCDSKSIGPAIQEANAAGIPVFTADIACLAPGAKVICHIATDNYQGGREACKAMVEALGGKGKVAIIDFPMVESVIMRTKGFEAELAEQSKKPGVDIKIVTKLNGGGVKDQGYKAAEDLLQAHPDVNGIFAINDPSALGARAALEKAGKADQIVLLGFDGQPEGKQAIKDGKIYADPIQFPDRIGTKTIEAIVKHFAGEEVPKEILIPTALYRKADGLKDPELK